MVFWEIETLIKLITTQNVKNNLQIQTSIYVNDKNTAQIQPEHQKRIRNKNFFIYKMCVWDIENLKHTLNLLQHKVSRLKNNIQIHIPICINDKKITQSQPKTPKNSRK